MRYINKWHRTAKKVANKVSKVPTYFFTSLAALEQCSTVLKQQAEKSLSGPLGPSVFVKNSEKKHSRATRRV